MPKIGNPAREIKLKEGLLGLKSQRQALKDAGYSRATYHSHISDCKVLKRVKAEVVQELNSAGLIEQFKDLIRKKMVLEKQVLEMAIKHRELKLKMQALNKSKDTITELHKSMRLESGDSTENIKIDEAERENRINRIRDKLLNIN